MDSKELLEKAKQAYYNVQHKEHTKRSFIAGYLMGYAEKLRQYNVEQSKQLICPCCGSDKTYKTDAIHCIRCAVTTEI